MVHFFSQAICAVTCIPPDLPHPQKRQNGDDDDDDADDVDDAVHRIGLGVG
jgi:hypothetical protein